MSARLLPCSKCSSLGTKTDRSSQVSISKCNMYSLLFLHKTGTNPEVSSAFHTHNLPYFAWALQHNSCQDLAASFYNRTPSCRAPTNNVIVRVLQGSSEQQVLGPKCLAPYIKRIVIFKHHKPSCPVLPKTTHGYLQAMINWEARGSSKHGFAAKWTFVGGITSSQNPPLALGSATLLLGARTAIPDIQTLRGLVARH